MLISDMTTFSNYDEYLQKLILRKLRISSNLVVDIDDIKLQNARIDIESISDELKYKIIRLIGGFPSEPLGTFGDTKEYKFPSNWWEQLKEEHAPQWFIHLFPIKYKLVTIHLSVDVSAVYPMLSLIYEDEKTMYVYESRIKDSISDYKDQK